MHYGPAADSARDTSSGRGGVGSNDNIRNLNTDWERTCARHPPREGDAIRYRITNHDGRTFEFDNYHLKPSTCEAAMLDAGFNDSRRVDAMLDPAEQANPFWHDFMIRAPLTAFCATRV